MPCTTEGSALKVNWVSLASFLASMMDYSFTFNAGFWTANVLRMTDPCNKLGRLEKVFRIKSFDFYTLPWFQTAYYLDEPCPRLRNLDISSEQITVSRLFLKQQYSNVGIMSPDFTPAIY